MKESRVQCGACASSAISEARHCRECRGLGFIEIIEREAGCTQQQPECPVVLDPMTGGWECRKCGAAGPA